MESSRLPLNPARKAPGRDAQSVLGFQFRDPSLFRRALTHRSFCNEEGLDATESYERLEYLGDAVLELTISDHLYRQFPNADEGQLTRKRVSLVRGETIAGVARRLRLGELLLVGRGVEDSGGRKQDSVLAAAFEALLAAVYLDQGFQAARDFVGRHMAAELSEITRTGADGAPHATDNPKGYLQELLQEQGRRPPCYHEAGRSGPDHNPVFTVEVILDGKVIGAGQGRRKADAEKAAAEAALELLQSGELVFDKLRAGKSGISPEHSRVDQ